MAAIHKTSTTRFKFKQVILKIVQQLSKKYLQEVAFLYDMDEHVNKEHKINGLRLFQDIINEGKLEHSSGELIVKLVEVLNSFQRSDLAKLLTEYCLKWNICYEEPSTHEESPNIATSCSVVKSGATKCSVPDQEEHVSTTTAENTAEDSQGSSSDEPQKINGTVMLFKGKKANKGRPRINSGLQAL